MPTKARLNEPYSQRQPYALAMTMLLVAIAACSGDEGAGGANEDGTSPIGRDGPSATPTPVAENRFASAYADAVCGTLADCCRSNGLAYDRSNCTAAAQGLVQAMLNRGRSSGLTFDPKVAGACLAAARSSAIACGQDTDNDACDRLFTGTKQPGAACDSSDECAPSTDGEVRCNNWFSEGKSGSLCQVVTRAGTGAACTATSTTPPPATFVDCEAKEDLYCDSARAVCVSMPKVGEACFISCAKSAFCSAGRCAARVAIGGACASDNPFNVECVDGAYCDLATTKTCLLKKAAGQSCAGNLECQTRRCNQGVCDASDDLTLSLFCGGGK